jgi:hypothetical protein
MRRAASGAGSSRSKTTSGSGARVAARGGKVFVICVANAGYPASLEIGKVYQTLGAPERGPAHRLRVIDESGEDYIYPSSYFRPIEISRPVQRALARAIGQPTAQNGTSRPA